MTAGPFHIKRGDTKKITVQLFESDDGTTRAVLTTTAASGGKNVTGATIVITVSGPGKDTTKIVDRGSVTLETAASGLVSYTFTAPQTASAAGTYRAELECSLSGVITTFPNPGTIPIVLAGDLDDPT